MKRSGFTLIELMIVIAIIAIIAAIAIPGLLAAIVSANQRNASASLKSIATSQINFRSNDSDGNRINDFWSGDVAGLYSMTSTSVTGSADVPLKLIDLAVAGADSAPLAAGSAGGELAPISTFAVQSPKSGYWYWAMDNDNSESPPEAYRQDTGGLLPMGAVHNNSRYGVMSYPNSLSSGRKAFIINEGATLFMRDLAASIRPSNSNPPGAVTTPGFTDWPDDAGLKANWSAVQ